MKSLERLIARHPDVIKERFGDVSTLTTEQAWELYDWTTRNVGYPRKHVDDSLIDWAEQIVVLLDKPERPVPRIHCAMPGCHNWIYDCASDRFQLITPYGAGCICEECLKEIWNVTS